MVKFILLGAAMIRNIKADPLLIKPEVGTWSLVSLGWWRKDWGHWSLLH